MMAWIQGFGALAPQKEIGTFRGKGKIMKIVHNAQLTKMTNKSSDLP